MTDRCGYEDTTTGEPCRHPAGSCPVPSHSDETVPDGGNPQGRPSLLEEYQDDIFTGARQGMTLQGCARLAGIDESTLHRWIDKYDEFRKSLKRARAHGELQRLQNANDPGARFILERSFGYVKTEKREVEHSGQIDGERTLGEEEQAAIREALDPGTDGND